MPNSLSLQTKFKLSANLEDITQILFIDIGEVYTYTPTGNFAG